MKTYAIEALFHAPYSRLVIATSFMDPFDDLTSIEKDLQGFQGKVLFDLLLVVGHSTNRFLEAFFDGEHILHASIKPTILPDPRLNAILSAFYTRHPDAIKASVLSRFDRLQLQKGTL